MEMIGERWIGWDDIPLDLETPVSTYLKMKREGAVFLLESVEKGERAGRFSIIGMNPDRRIFINNNCLSINDKKLKINRENFVHIMRDFLKECSTPLLPEIDFFGGWVGYIGYDLVRYMEDIKFRKKAGSPFPDGILYSPSKLIIFDHIKHTGKIIAFTKSPSEVENAIESIKNNFKRKIKFPEKKRIQKAHLRSSMEEVEFIGNVERIKEYIREGDILQAVLSIRFEGKTSAHPFEIYRALRILNPSPYMFYLDFHSFQIIGSSPESHAKLKNGIVSIRPIAGTRKRGRSGEEDLEMETELLQSEKERAEHIMLIDLARNDLGKICLPGSINVSERMAIEKYSHVMHIVSQVEGKMRPGEDFLDVLQATFPAGTVTGAPKIRAMEIIDELEPVRRGPYGGVIGYFGMNGTMDVCIGIRMIIYRKGKYHLQAGAGIVDGSIPSHELKEVHNKIQGMSEAIKRAEHVQK